MSKNGSAQWGSIPRRGRSPRSRCLHVRVVPIELTTAPSILSASTGLGTIMAHPLANVSLHLLLAALASLMRLTILMVGCPISPLTLDVAHLLCGISRLDGSLALCPILVEQDPNR